MFGEHVEIVFADDGQAAVDSVAEVCPDFILMDAKMPVLNGIEATRRIRQMTLPKKVTIVGVTGLDDVATMRECMAAGMDEVLTKPLREHQLMPFAEIFKRAERASVAAELVDETFVRSMDPAFCTQLLAEWRKSCLEQVSTVRIMVENCDCWGVQEAAHSLKGSSSQVGAIRLSQTAVKLQEMCACNSPSQQEVRTLVEELSTLSLLTFERLGLK
jgi:CheY-like chemotaxis protein